MSKYEVREYECLGFRLGGFWDGLWHFSKRSAWNEPFGYLNIAVSEDDLLDGSYKIMFEQGISR